MPISEFALAVALSIPNPGVAEPMHMPPVGFRYTTQVDKEGEFDVRKLVVRATTAPEMPKTAFFTGDYLLH